jgi:hypothetical protein
VLDVARTLRGASRPSGSGSNEENDVLLVEWACSVARLLPDRLGSPEPFLERVLAACRALPVPASPASSNPTSDRWNWVVASVAFEAWERERIVEAPAGELEAGKTIRKQLFPFFLIGKAACLVGAEHPASSDEIRRLEQIVADFAAAIGPRRLRWPLVDPEAIEKRLALFVERREQDDSAIDHWAREALRGLAPPMSAHRRDRFFAKIPVARLRTYDPALLLEVGRHVVNWDPLVEFLEGKPLTTAERRACENRIEQLRRDLLRSTARHCRMGQADVEAAVQEAWTRLCSSARYPSLGYAYEGDLRGWLASTSLNIVWSGIRRMPDQLDEDRHGTLPDRHKPFDQEEWQRFLCSWQERYCLVESTFREARRPVVKEIWRALLQEDGRGDRELAEYLTTRCGQNVTASNVPQLRRKLRQRLGALRFVLDEVPSGDVDLPGDVSMLAWVEDRWGLQVETIPTVRGLAALGRAAAGEPTLLWARVSKRLVESGEDDAAGLALAERRHALSASARRGGAGFASRSGAHRLWCSGPRLTLLRRIRGMTLTAHVAFFLPACWYLAHFRQFEPDAAVERLRPDRQGPWEEEKWVRWMLEWNPSLPTPIVRTGAVDGLAAGSEVEEI